MSKTLIFSATYNERDNINELIKKINKYSKILDIHGLRMIDKNYTPGFKACLHLKYLNIASKIAKKLKLKLNGAAYVNKLMKLAIHRKLNNKDSSVINKIIEEHNK